MCGSARDKNRVSIPDSHGSALFFFGKLNSDSHWSEKRGPDPHSGSGSPLKDLDLVLH